MGWKVEILKFGRTKVEVMNRILILSSEHKYQGKNFKAMMTNQPLFRSLVSFSSQIQGKLRKNMSAQRSSPFLLQWLIVCRGQNMSDFLNETMKILVMHYCFIPLLLPEQGSMRQESHSLLHVNNVCLIQLNAVALHCIYTNIKLKL